MHCVKKRQNSDPPPWDPAPGQRGKAVRYGAVFLVSLSSLAYEVLLARTFSISQWHHLSFMVISIALFGFAASGTVLNLLDPVMALQHRRFSGEKGFRALGVLFAVSAVLAFALVNRVPLDYFRIPLEAVQALYLLAAYCLLAIPFFFAGSVMVLAYAADPEQSGAVYLASMAGSAVGAAVPALLLPLLGEGRLMAMVSLLPLLIAAWPGATGGMPPSPAAPVRPHNRGHGKPIILTAGMAAASAVFVLWAPAPLLEIRPSPYKALSQVLKFPQTEVTGTSSGIRGRVDRVAGPALRFAPGLSLKSRDPLPGQEVLYTDGDAGLFLYRLKSAADCRFARNTLAYAGYHLAPPSGRALLMVNDGGSAIPAALVGGMARLEVVTPHPAVARALASHYGLLVAAEPAMAFLAGSTRQWDVIHVENWGGSMVGAGALTQDYGFTLEAMSQYLAHLTPDGVLLFTRKLLLPPAHSLRLWATAYEALKASGFASPEKHMALLRGWDVFTLIVARRPLENTARIEAFADRLNFDVVHLPGGSEARANRFNRFDRAYHFDAIRDLAAAYAEGREADHRRSGLLDVAPQTIDRPYPEKFLQWRKALSLYESVGSRIYAILLSGEMVVGVVFAEALGISLLLLIPVLAAERRPRRGRLREIGYFLSVGAGFMFLELYFVHAMGLLFANPVISLSVVLSALLVFSGAGGYLSRRLPVTRVGACLAGLVLLQAGLFWGFGRLGAQILAWSAPARIMGAVVLLSPAGILAGIPFPVGMRTLPPDPRARAGAWAANGCASVLAAVGSAQLAISTGISSMLLFSAGSYLTALVCIVGTGKSQKVTHPSAA